ncbi:MAG: hypothetical protein AAB556_01410 [Patescibacteria group bacterium]
MKRPIIIVAVAIVLFAVYFFYLRPERVFGPELPSFFPQEMIGDSYIVDLEVLNDAGKLDGEIRRATVSYRSHKSVEEILKGFKDYFAANAFMVEDLPESELAKFLGARKDKTSVSIAFWKESPVRVSILYIVSK